MVSSSSKKEEVKINGGHYLEVLDRLHVQMSMMDEHLFKHPVVEQNKELRGFLIKAIVHMIHAYQEAGALATQETKKTLVKKKRNGKK